MGILAEASRSFVRDLFAFLLVTAGYTTLSLGMVYSKLGLPTGWEYWGVWLTGYLLVLWLTNRVLRRLRSPSPRTGEVRSAE